MVPERLPDTVYAEVLFFFPMNPYEAPGKHHPELIDFYNQCSRKNQADNIGKKLKDELAGKDVALLLHARRYNV